MHTMWLLYAMSSDLSASLSIIPSVNTIINAMMNMREPDTILPDREESPGTILKSHCSLLYSSSRNIYLCIAGSD